MADAGPHTDPHRPPPRIDKPVVLIGMMGSGKTTIGRILARELSVPFVDADSEIEQAAGMTIADYFEQFGEAEFRRGEERVMKRLLDTKPVVLATGGGAVISGTTRRIIKEKTFCIWLKSDLQTLLRRTANKNTRPLLHNGDPRETLARLMDERTPFYEGADLTVESGNTSRGAIIQRIITHLT